MPRVLNAEFTEGRCALAELTEPASRDEILLVGDHGPRARFHMVIRRRQVEQGGVRDASVRPHRSVLPSGFRIVTRRRRASSGSMTVIWQYRQCQPSRP
jgi:hypothetical protein